MGIKDRSAMAIMTRMHQFRMQNAKCKIGLRPIFAFLILNFALGFAQAAESLSNPTTMNTNTNALPLPTGGSLPAASGLTPVPSEPLVPDALLEEGKMLYDSGHYM